MTPDMVLSALIGTLMLISLCILWYILREISKHLGVALQMPKYYRLYDLSILLALAGYSMGFIEYALNPGPGTPAATVLPIIVGLTFLAAAIVMALVTSKYWGWIVPEVLALRKK